MKTINRISVHELTEATPEMGWCPKGNHQTYFYEVDRFVITTGLKETTNKVMACTCGYATVWHVGTEFIR
jgi:hypothetical protein